MLELWPDPDQDFSTVNKEQILEKVNGELDPSFSINQLMNPIRDSNGRIIGAKALSMSWFGQVNVSEISEDDLAESEDGQAVDLTTLDFEKQFRDLMLAFGAEKVEPLGLKLFVNVQSGYADAAGEQIMDDALYMPIGFSIVGLYVTLMLGRFTCVENRVKN